VYSRGRQLPGESLRVLGVVGRFYPLIWVVQPGEHHFMKNYQALSCSFLYMTCMSVEYTFKKIFFGVKEDTGLAFWNAEGPRHHSEVRT
jgi:hypothetical protein